MIKAKVISLSGGYKYDQEYLKQANLKIGDILEVDKIIIESFSTEIYLRGYKYPFNSVNFSVLKNDDLIDIKTTFDEPNILHNY